MRSSSLIIAALAFAFLPEKTFSQTGDAKSLLAQVIAKNSNRYSKIASLEYSARVIYKVHPESQTNPSNEVAFHETEIEYRSKGPLYKIASRQRISPEADFGEKVAAYDGVHYQGFRTDELRLTLSKNTYIGEVTFGSNVIFAPFLNLLIPETNSVYTQDTTEVYTAPGNWNAFQDRSLSSSELKHSNGELTVSVPVSIPHSNRSVLESSFSLENQFPIKWSFKDKNGQLSTVCQVDEFFKLPAGSAGSEGFLFPKKMTAVDYVNGKPHATTTVIIESIKVNQEIDDAEFTIDPSTALNIHDVDSDTVISMPH